MKANNKRGITIYQPSGAAAEYSKWACNLYNGCSNKCEYCYNRHGQGAKLLGKDEPTIKGGMDEETIFGIFCKELAKWKDEIEHDGGLFFNFVSDPCLPETYRLNLRCIEECVKNGVHVTMLTKKAFWVNYSEWRIFLEYLQEFNKKDFIKFGFTITGQDDLEPLASANDFRIKAMSYLHSEGFKTWASFEPIINTSDSYKMYRYLYSCCDEFRFGLLSGKKKYTKGSICSFIGSVQEHNNERKPLKWKKSVIDFIKKEC